MMRVPTITGLIRRRLLVNYHAEPSAVQRLLPKRFRPKLHAGHAIIGICLIRLEQIRPRPLPAIFGISSENAAHRIAVEWQAAEGVREGVYIARRDTGSWLNHLAGGRLFPGAHQLASFRVTDRDDQIDLRMDAADGDVYVRVCGGESETLPVDSYFDTLADSSDFFERGCVGWSPGSDRAVLDGLRLETMDWKIRPFTVTEATSSWFDAHLPKGAFAFDHALLMRDVAHEWHEEPQMVLSPEEVPCVVGR